METNVLNQKIKQGWLQIGIFITLFACSWLNAILTLPDKHVVMFFLIEATMSVIVR